MPQSKAASDSAAPAGLPDCPLCSTRMVVQRIIPGRLGLEHWTLRCTKCGHIHQDAVDKASPSYALPPPPTLWPET